MVKVKINQETIWGIISAWLAVLFGDFEVVIQTHTSPSRSAHTTLINVLCTLIQSPHLSHKGSLLALGVVGLLGVEGACVCVREI